MNDHDVWRDEVAHMSEMDRVITESEYRRSVGMVGGPEDAND